MNNNKINELLQKVILASRAKKINWVKNPKSETSFKAELGSNTIYILKVDSSSHAFIILNSEGDTIGNITEIFSRDLGELYDLAFNKALKIEENLDEIDNMLDSIL